MSIEDPLAGWPRTRRTEDGYRLDTKVLAPGRLRFLEEPLKMLMLGWMFLMLYVGTESEHAPAIAIWTATAGFGLLVTYVVGNLVLRLLGQQRAVARRLVGKRLVMTFRDRTLRVRRKTYSLDYPHSFELLTHENALEEEAEQEERYRTERNPRRLRRFWRDSYHIVFRYMNQRIDLAEVYGQKDAEQLLMRLQLLAWFSLSGDDPLQGAAHAQAGDTKRKRGRERAREKAREKAEREARARAEQQARSERERRAHEERSRREEKARGNRREQRGAGETSALQEALAVFGLAGDFDCEALRKRFRELSQKLHPDKGGSDFFQRHLNNAYQTLKAHKDCR
jgi:hypothetical protein